MALVPLSGGKLLGGTTTAPGTGGETKAKEAELYIFDMATKQVEWHEPVFKGAQHYTDLLVGPAGTVFGFADRKRFFVFDPTTRTIVHQRDVSKTFGLTTYGQGPRVFVPAPDNRIFVLFAKGIAQLDPVAYELTMLAESPITIAPGGAWLDGRIYFGHSSHLYSWEAPAAQ